MNTEEIDITLTPYQIGYLTGLLNIRLNELRRSDEDRETVMVVGMIEYLDQVKV